jgi:predicted dehydrogenase
MRATLGLPDGVSATISSSMVATRAEMAAVVSGSRGEMTVESFIAPHGGGAIEVRLATGSRREEARPPSSFAHQLRAFVEAVRTGRPPITSGEDTVANARVVDALLAAY